MEESAPKRRSPGGLCQPYLTEGQEANNSFLANAPNPEDHKTTFVVPHLGEEKRTKQRPANAVRTVVIISPISLTEAVIPAIAPGM